jgi:carnitine O-acetyltransferase
MTTFQHQKELQKLPIPPLEDSIRRYIEVLKPLQTKDEHEKTINACSEFIKTSGPILQEQLLQYSKTRDSYIEQFWFDSYLNYDSPVVLNLNPFIMIEDDPIPGDCNWINRGTELTCSTLRFIHALRNKKLPVDYIKGKNPLDMDQYLRLFGSARIPTNNGCVLQTDKYSKHIIVLVNSQFYWFNVLDDDNNLLLTQEQIKLNLKSIIDDSKNIDPKDIAKSSFGILTTENRKIWSNIRTKLNKDKVNRDILKTIDSALFCLVLDDLEIGEDLNKMSQNFLCGKSILKDGIQVGTCTNRWYDKLQLIITKDGKSGINFEHTGVDGHTVLRFASDIYTDSILRFAKTINKDSPSIFNDDFKTNKNALVNSEPPRKLEWNLTNDISLALRFAETRLSDLINQNEFSTLSFNKFGMERIKKMGMSPDAFVQMSFQLTYYSLYGKVECTYEPAMTKKFLHGRTEAIRTVSEESNEFVTKFLQKDIDSKTKIELLKNACKKHSERTRECSNGLGQDRHLYALFCIWKRYFGDSSANTSDDEYENESDELSSDSTIDFNHLPETVDSIEKLKQIPSIFADDGWDKLNTTIISTSNCGNPSLKIFGFGPVSENGFGLGYIIKDNRISICASSKHRQTSRFTSSLETTLTLMEKTFREAYESEKELADIGSPKNKEIEKLLGGYPSYEVDANSDAIKSKDGDSNEKKFFTNKEIGRKLRFSEY